MPLTFFLSLLQWCSLSPAEGDIDDYLFTSICGWVLCHYATATVTYLRNVIVSFLVHLPLQMRRYICDRLRLTTEVIQRWKHRFSEGHLISIQKFIKHKDSSGLPTGFYGLFSFRLLFWLTVPYVLSFFMDCAINLLGLVAPKTVVPLLHHSIHHRSSHGSTI